MSHNIYILMTIIHHKLIGYNCQQMHQQLPGNILPILTNIFAGNFPAYTLQEIFVILGRFPFNGLTGKTRILLSQISSENGPHSNVI
jgi:hypothetical protein